MAVEHPEVRLARRLVSRHKLTPPIDVEALIREHATLAYTAFPVDGVDGVCLNMKAGPENARVLINQFIGAARRRFTLAHELGHLLIPWHVGSSIDNIDLNSPIEAFAANEEYLRMEAEANRFAAELLMPTPWVGQLIDDHDYSDLAEVHRKVTHGAGVSPIASAIHISEFLFPGTVWVIETNGLIQNHGMSAGTLVPRIWGKDHTFDADMYHYAERHYQWTNGSSTIHWWELPSELPTQNSDERTWQEILEKMLNDIGCTDPVFEKQSINGIIGAVNSKLKAQAKHDIIVTHTAKSLAAACLQRFADSEHTAFFKHDDFMTFIQKRATAVFNKPTPRKRK